MTTVIKEDDTMIDAIKKMGDGNIGAMSWMMSIISSGDLKRIDPDCPSPLMMLLSMDLLGIRGVLIWKLFKYCCDQDNVRTIAAIRAAQLGLVSQIEFMQGIEKGEEMDFVSLVQERLPRFGQAQDG